MSGTARHSTIDGDHPVGDHTAPEHTVSAATVADLFCTALAEDAVRALPGRSDVTATVAVPRVGPSRDWQPNQTTQQSWLGAAGHI